MLFFAWEVPCSQKKHYAAAVRSASAALPGAREKERFTASAKMSNKQASEAVAALQAKRRANNKPYLGDDAGGSATLPPSTSAWAVQWKPPSTASRKELQVRAEARV